MNPEGLYFGLGDVAFWGLWVAVILSTGYAVAAAVLNDRATAWLDAKTDSINAWLAKQPHFDPKLQLRALPGYDLAPCEVRWTVLHVASAGLPARKMKRLLLRARRTAPAPSVYPLLQACLAAHERAAGEERGRLEF